MIRFIISTPLESLFYAFFCSLLSISVVNCLFTLASWFWAGLFLQSLSCCKDVSLIIYFALPPLIYLYCAFVVLSLSFLFFSCSFFLFCVFSRVFFLLLPSFNGPLHPSNSHVIHNARQAKRATMMWYYIKHLSFSLGPTDSFSPLSLPTIIHRLCSVFFPLYDLLSAPLCGRQCKYS